MRGGREGGRRRKNPFGKVDADRWWQSGAVLAHAVPHYCPDWSAGVAVWPEGSGGGVPLRRGAHAKHRERKIKINTHRELYWPDVKIQEMYEAAYLNGFWQLTSPPAVQCTGGLESRASAATCVNIKETCTLRPETLLNTNLFISQTENYFKGYLPHSCYVLKEVKKMNEGKGCSPGYMFLSGVSKQITMQDRTFQDEILP